MAVIISGFEDSQHKYRQRKGLSRLYAFFMFDDRPSHHPIGAFADEGFAWLDQLATSADMFFFIFGKSEEGTIAVNPSLEVARLFGVGPDELPGVLVFTSFDENDEVNHGAYLRLKAGLFDHDLSGVERAFSELFALFQDVQRDIRDDDRLLDTLDHRMRLLRVDNQLRPILQLIVGGLKSLTTLPKDFLTAMATAFGEAAAKRFG
jgi:hypothetical protein